MASSPLTIVVAVELPEHLREQFASSFPDQNLVFIEHLDAATDLERADALIAWGASPAHLSNATRLKWFQTVSAGVDRVDQQTLRARGILLTNSSGIHANNIAEHILAMMLSFSRRLPEYLDNQRAGTWKRAEERPGIGGPGIFEITGQTLFVVGMGRIGGALGKRAKGLEMNVVGTVKRTDKERPAFADEVILESDLQSRIGEADHVAICLPLTPGTTGLFSAAMLGAMKDGAFIYNIGRGAIIEQDALYTELSSGRLGGAGLDVTTPEPLPDGHPLWSLQNVIITPHTSGYSPKLMERAVPLWIENVRRFVAGEPLLNLIDFDAGY